MFENLVCLALAIPISIFRVGNGHVVSNVTVKKPLLTWAKKPNKHTKPNENNKLRKAPSFSVTCVFALSLMMGKQIY